MKVQKSARKLGRAMQYTKLSLMKLHGDMNSLSNDHFDNKAASKYVIFQSYYDRTNQTHIAHVSLFPIRQG